MGDLTLSFKADQLGKSLDNLGEALTNELNSAVEDLANATHAKILADVQARINNDNWRQDYLKAVELNDLGTNSYLITLTGDWPEKIEEGFPSYDQRDVLLTSTKKVEIGSRAGEDWVQRGEDQARYAHVPIQRHPFSQTNDLSREIKKMTATNRDGVEQRVTQIFKDASGKAIQGKVARAKSSNPLLDQLTKYQHTSPGGDTSSIYINYRTISDNGTGWQHPGHPGYKFFESAEKWAEAELENIINVLL